MIGPLAYIGGKRRIAKRLIEMFPAHTTYVEPFAGGAQVFFHKAPSKVEVLNDADGEIVNFLRVCQWHSEELTRHLVFMVASRRIFEVLGREDPTQLTDVQRAARFLYLQKNSFGGRVNRQNYHYCVTEPPNYSPASVRLQLTEATKRLDRVQIEHGPYQAVIARYDRPTTLFFLDPPYIGLNLYRHNMADDDFRELAELLGRIRGKFLMTINDHPLARELFERFRVSTIRLTYTASRSAPKASELVVANY